MRRSPRRRARRGPGGRPVRGCRLERVDAGAGLLRDGIAERLNARLGGPLVHKIVLSIERPPRPERDAASWSRESRNRMTILHSGWNPGPQGLEAVRKRPAMYIGGTGANGCTISCTSGRQLDRRSAGRHCDHVQVYIGRMAP